VASAADAAIAHMRDWYLGTPAGDWVSAGIWSTGQYGTPEGLMVGLPVTSDGSGWTVVEGLTHSEMAQARIAKSIAELAEEREAVTALGLI
jgi:malate dehydrogenase